MNVKEFYENIIMPEIKRELWNKDIIAYFSHTKISEKEKIGLRCNIWETAKQFGVFVTFKLKDDVDLDKPAIHSIDAFELMRIALMQNYLPEFNTSRNSFNQLCIDLCEWIKINGDGWIRRDNVNTIGKKFITDLSKSLWYIDNYSYKTLNDRFKIPEVFINFFNRTHPESYKKA